MFLNISDKLRLAACLKCSPVKLVRLDPILGEPTLQYWANACEQANKEVFLWLPGFAALPQKAKPLQWAVKRLLDRLIAGILLLLLGPLMVGIAILIGWNSRSSVFIPKWCVGAHGKLFRLYAFRLVQESAQMRSAPAITEKHIGFEGESAERHQRMIALSRWIQKYGLDQLPQLLNVMRGEISLIGPCPWAVSDAVLIRKKRQLCLHALPGLTGSWRWAERSHLLDRDTVSWNDLQHLRNWSLQQDFKKLLVALPRLISGFSV
jgi:lipopolysaccharide/colanic/teichoic acid biosynthesis glycosyltransferase